MTRDELPAFRLLPDEDEPEPDAGQLPRPAAGFSRRTRLAAGCLATVLLLAGGSYQLHRARHAAQLARMAHSDATAPPDTGGVPDAAVNLPQWPHAATGVCGGPGGLLPILTTKPLAERTGVRLTVGSSGVRTVDLDTGAVSPGPQVALREGSLVLDRRTLGRTSYLVVNSCGGALRVLEYSPGRLAANVGTDIASSMLFGDGTDGVWTASFTPGTTQAGAQLQVRMVRLDRPGAVLLPANTFPLALSGHLIVGETISATGQGPALVVFDSAQHRIVRELGPTSSLTQSRGVVIWTSQPCSAATGCQLHTFDVRTGRGTARSYSLPVEAGVTGGALSPDHSRLAFQLPRMSDDPRYSTELPGSPSDLVVLNLASGILEPVPNLEVPPGSELGLTFSADSRWLVAAVSGKDGPQLLAWRSGLNNALVSPARLPGPVPNPLPFLAEPAGSNPVIG